MSCLAQIPELTAFYFEEEVSVDEEARVWLDAPDSLPVIKSLEEILSCSSEQELSDSLNLIKAVQKQSGQKGKKLYMPIRVALTGKTGGPELTEAVSILGRDRCLQRVRRILKMKGL
jgi:nondiscriminating glutamyl-tRNA synthetase